MSDKTVNNYGGTGVLGLLGVAFVVLKLTHYIDWPWWYVLLPFWGGLALIAAVCLIMGLVWLAMLLISAWLDARKCRGRLSTRETPDRWRGE